MDPTNTIYQLSIRGKLAPQTLEAARNLHNQTAGAPANVAAARSLGDLSHMVYIPVEHTGPGSGEFLILDLWNSMEGLSQFFANPTVQEQGGQIFSERDPVVWAPAEGFYSYNLPSPAGQNDRYVGIVRGMVASRAEAKTLHNALASKLINKARLASNLSHQAYFRLTPPGVPESLEFFAVDVWSNLAGMGKHYEDPDFISGFAGMFVAPPSATVWVHPSGEWVEW